MKWILVGLGNPGGEYARTRHNAGRIILDIVRETNGIDEWEMKKPYQALAAKGEIAGSEVLLLEPETFMNDSGKSLVTLVKSKKQAEQLVVIHDDLDLPLGTWKLSFDRGSGGQKGVDSIMRTIKTKAFVRVRIGITPTAFLSRKLKKPKGEDAVVKHILGKFTESEMKELGKLGKEVAECIATLIKDGRDRAMGEWNKK